MLTAIVANHKGGVGKTTTAVTLASASLPRWLPAILDPGPLGPNEVDLVRWAIRENDGGLAIENIQHGLGLSPWQARRLAEAWQARGWLEKRGPATLPRQITGSLVELLERLEDGEQFADV